MAVIFRYKNGRIIPIQVDDTQTTNDYMNNKIKNSKMKRIYDEAYSKWSNEPDTKRFIGYEYKDYKIRVQKDYSTRAFGYEGKTWYYTTLKNGKEIATDRLKEMRKYIDEDTKK